MDQTLLSKGSINFITFIKPLIGSKLLGLFLTVLFYYDWLNGQTFG